MWAKRIKDIVAMLLIGDGALTLIGARERALVWRFGPEGLRNSASWQAEHPHLMRVEGAASIALGVLLARGQYRDPHDPIAFCKEGDPVVGELSAPSIQPSASC